MLQARKASSDDYVWRKEIDPNEFAEMLRNAPAWVAQNFVVIGGDKQVNCLLQDNFTMLLPDLRGYWQEGEKLIVHGIHGANFVSVHPGENHYNALGIMSPKEKREYVKWPRSTIEIHEESVGSTSKAACAHEHLKDHSWDDVVKRIVFAASYPQEYLNFKYEHEQVINGVNHPPKTGREFTRKTHSNKGDRPINVLIVGRGSASSEAPSTCENDLGTSSGNTITVNSIVFKLYR